ncbi:EamA family transporter [Aliamphritea spongicola]|uniref:EamA family transporter n=1 Tax=Aliamphritea spongicola TaxID=707589 RepID=UPI00196B632A|nr:DMT family transporter [Aliamphritea spongicola]
MSDSRNTALSSPYLLLTLAPLFWGGNAVVGKLAATEWNAIEFTFLRWVFAVALIGFIARSHLKKDWPVIRENWWKLCLMGGFGFVGFNLCLYGALHYTSAINVSIEQAAIPVFIMVLNRILFSQQVFGLQILGVVIATIGVVITVTQGNPAILLNEGLNRGDAIMIIAIVFYSVYSVSLRWRPQIHDLSFIFSLAVVSLAVLMPLIAWNTQSRGLPEITADNFLLIIYVAIFPSFLAQLFYAKGVARIGANRGGIFINLVPIFGALMAVVVLGEAFKIYHMIGLVMVLAGIGLAEWVVRQHNKKQELS